MNKNSQQENRYEETTISTQDIYQGKVIKLQVDEVKLPNGEVGTREIVKHPGAVAVLAIVEDKMLVVEQYRKALGRSLIEIPAGKLEAGEKLEIAAARELEEETGWQCDTLELICSFYTSPGFADEIVHLFFAEKLERGTASLDEDEFLDAFSLSLQEAKACILDGRIRDAKTITAVYAWERYNMTGRLQP